MSSLALPFSVQPVRASGTIYIRADGSIDPPTASISNLGNTTYVLTDNITGSIMVERDNIILEGNQFALLGESSGRGVDISSTENVTVENMKIQMFEIGIFACSARNDTIRSNRITNSTERGIEVNGTSTQIMISDNVIVGCVQSATWRFDGIQLDQLSNITISGNFVAGHNDGIQIDHAHDCLVCGNNVTQNIDDGIQPYWSTNITISGNYVSHNGQDGIPICESTDILVIGNNIVENERWGVEANQYSGHRIYHNNFIDNVEKEAKITMGQSAWDDGYPSGGNYWSDYGGIDEKSGPNQDWPGNDGIGDTPYSIDINNSDRYPLMVPWGTPYDQYDWPMFQHDLQHTGYSASKISNDLGSLWNFSDRENARCSSPVVYRGIVFVNIWGQSIENGILWALNETNGQPIWSYPVEEMPYNSPTVCEDKVFVGTQSGTFYCLSLEGDLLWNFTCEYNPYEHGISPIWSSPIIDSGKVYFLTEGGVFYALNTTNGQVVWTYQSGSITLEQSSPAIWNGVLYFGSVAGGFRAVNATDGTEIWKFVTGGAIVDSATVVDGKVYIGSADYNFYCLNATNGMQIWKFTAEGPIYYSPAVCGDRIFFSDRTGFYGESGKVYALNISDGTLIWNVSTSKRVRTSIVAADSKIFVGSLADIPRIYALNVTDGSCLWSYDTKSPWVLSTSFAIANQKLFVGSDKLYAFSEYHDIAVLNLTTSKTGCRPLPTLGENCTLTLNATVGNLGTHTENFTITFYDNTTEIMEENVSLASREHIVFSFDLNSTGWTKGNYTVRVYIEPVSGEADTTNNLLEDSFLVTILGDTNGDGKVDVKDVYATALAYGTSVDGPNPEGRKYNPNCDINNDLGVDVKDYYIVCKHYGEVSL
jgi:parallel beta-helix repeat protein